MFSDMLGDDLVGVDIDHRQRGGDRRQHLELVHGSSWVRAGASVRLIAFAGTLANLRALARFELKQVNHARKHRGQGIARFPSRSFECNLKFEITRPHPGFTQHSDNSLRGTVLSPAHLCLP